MRYTGFTPAVKDLILARSSGMCEVMVDGICSMHGEQFHHRRPRGAGGTRRIDTNHASNGLYICGLCHLHIETNRREAKALGWLVSQWGRPVEEPVLWRGRQRWLDDDGGFEPPAVADVG
ncbi:hypothetical protein ACPXCG_18830 [Gordonia sp. DT218]|uniref:hypothetical protein n=1 Tax=Gordonia sp. DT218 TaxID=3416659 RepID=UPI003CF0E4EC